MDKLVIYGGKKLKGEVEISGAKNAVVAIIPAAILASKGICTIDNIPRIQDVDCFEKILENIGCKLKKGENSLSIDSSNILTSSACTEDVRKMRASYYLIGALLGRFKEAIVELPGGCSIGVRPIDQHIKAFKALGADIKIEHGKVIAKAENLVGTNIFFDVVSVGATINTMIAATLAEGVTTLENVAREPHVVDVANFLNTMGAKIRGAGTDEIKITGVKELQGCSYSVIPDQIEAGTYMIATAACGGEVRVKNVIPKHMESVTAKLLESGMEVIEDDDSILVIAKERPKSLNVKTLPYPGFPTDVQQPMCAMLAIADGRSIINESVWEARFKYIDELKKMGADIKVEGRTAIITGVKKLTGASLYATDLRAGASMIVAALMAEGKSTIGNLSHVDRGYPNIEEKFKQLGCDIERINN